jgi:integrase
MKITKKSVDAAKPNGKDQIYWDDEVKRFGLRVKPAGAKSYLIQYRNAQGRTRKLTIGSHGPWTPDTARERAKELLREVDSGNDPAHVVQEERNAINIQELCKRYFIDARKGHPDTLKRNGQPIKKSTLDTDETRIARHVYPLLGKRAAKDVAPNDIKDFIVKVTEGRTKGVFKTEKLRGKAVVKGGAGAARRTVARLSAIFSYAVAQKILPSNPCLSVRKTPDQRKEINISREQYAALGTKLSAIKAEWQFTKIAKLIALTGLRHKEAVKLKFSEIDFVHRCIRLEDSKTGASMRPLGSKALELLASIKRGDSPYVFPGIVDLEKPYGAFAKTFNKYITKNTSITPHALRHGFAGVAHDLGISEIVLAHLLGHRTTQTTTRKYIHAPEKMLIDAATRISDYISDAMERVKKDNVVHVSDVESLSVYSKQI